MTIATLPLRPVVTIELVGSFTARHVESGTTVDLTGRRNRSTTKSPLPVLCRELLAHGLDPVTRAHVIRKALDRDGFIPVFKRDRTLAVWAGLDAVESETRSVHVEKHRPYRGPVKGKGEQEVAEVTKRHPGEPAAENRINGSTGSGSEGSSMIMIDATAPTILPGMCMQYTSEILDRKTGEMVSIDQGHWITMDELSKAFGIGRRQLAIVLHQMNFLQIEGTGSNARNRIQDWVIAKGYGKRNKRKSDGMPFDVVSSEGVRWIAERWEAARKAVEAKTSGSRRGSPRSLAGVQEAPQRPHGWKAGNPLACRSLPTPHPRPDGASPQPVTPVGDSVHEDEE